MRFSFFIIAGLVMVVALACDSGDGDDGTGKDGAGDTGMDGGSGTGSDSDSDSDIDSDNDTDTDTDTDTDSDADADADADVDSDADADADSDQPPEEYMNLFFLSGHGSSTYNFKIIFPMSMYRQGFVDLTDCLPSFDEFYPTDGGVQGSLDAGYDGGDCIHDAGETECVNNNDCSSLGAECICPKLFGTGEETSFCFPSCDALKPCRQKNDICYPKNSSGTEGVCLDSTYYETEWQASYIPYPGTPFTDEWSAGIAQERLYLGSMDLWFTNATAWVRLDPFDPPGTGACEIQLMEAVGYGGNIQALYYRAFSYQNTAKTMESWINFDAAPLVRGELASGTLKIFLVRYSAELVITP